MKKFGSIFLVLILLICCLTSCDFFEFLQSEATTAPTETTKNAETTEHVHQWLSATGEHARICADCNEKQLIPEAHDWQYVGQISDCWSTNITYACSKCHEEQLVHGDSVLPSHIWAEETANGKTTLNCTRCNESITFISEIGKFSRSEEHTSELQSPS